MKNNKNVSLESTNVKLTGNIKLVIDTQQDLFLESINSTSALSSIMLKGFIYNEYATYGSNIKSFVDSNFISDDQLYAVKSDNSNLINNDFGQQYSSIYKYGCYSEASQVVNENLRFFAPIYINDVKTLPDHFLIVRHNNDEIKANEYRHSNNILDLLKGGTIVEMFDLSKIKNILKKVEQSYVYVNFDNDKNDDSIVLHGLDYRTGLYGQRLYTGFSDVLHHETTMSEFNNNITSLFSQVDLIFSNILNLEFAFTDEEMDGFANYTGVYLTEEEVSSILALKNHEYPTKFIKGHTLREFKKEKTLSTYEEFLNSNSAISIGLQEYKEISVKFVINPQPNDKIQIYTNDHIDYELIIRRSFIAKDLKETLDNIVSEININYTGEESTIEASFNQNNELILRTKNISNDNLFLKVISSSVQFDNVTQLIEEDTIPDDLHVFKGSTIRTFVSRLLVEEAKIILHNNQKYNILRIYKFEDLYYYDVDRIIEKGKSLKIEFFAIRTEKPIIGKILPHAKLDTSIEDVENFDVLDFNHTEYQMFLLQKVNHPDFRGSVEVFYGHSDVTEDELNEYKALVSSKINAYFNGISYAKNYLIKNIDLMDMSSDESILLNPYERLDENNLTELRETNRMHQFIQKWRLHDSVDSYFNPYLLNISLAMRSDNFCSAVMNGSRDLREHTLHWFILGSGRPPYFTEKNSSQNDRLSYTKSIVQPESILSTTDDYYDTELSDLVNGKFMSSWSNLKYDELQETCFTIFKGVKYKIDDKTLDGYRFSIILKSDIVRETANGFDIDYLRNDVFKTFTMLVYFYIPEPILTTLEGEIPYFVDRSLLYFSNEIYSTQGSQINFGESPISLDLFNTTAIKKFNTFETTKAWLIYNDEIESWMMYVHRGNLGRFKSSFKEILELGGSLVCQYTQSEDVNSPYYGMIMTFADIVEINHDGFWCKTVSATIAITEDTDGIDDDFIEDNEVQDIQTINVIGTLIHNEQLINSINFFYYTKHIAYELFTYNKVVSSYANNIRYQSITLSSLVAALKLSFIANPYNVSVIEPDGFFAPISLTVENKGINSELKKLDTPYFYPMYRHEGKYVPLLKSIFDFNNDQVVNSSTTIDYRKFATVLSNDYVSQKFVSSYEKSILSIDDENYKYLMSTQDNNETYLDLPWLLFPKEKRNFSSVCFNSDEELVDYVNLTNEWVFENICKFKHSTWLNLLDIKINENLEAIQAYYLHSTGSKITVDEIRKKAIIEFVKNVFLVIYRIDTITDVNGLLYEYSIDDTKITINGPSNIPYIVKYVR